MKVMIAGGGISGLALAFRLKRGAQDRGIPLDLTVVEASPRLGGTIFTDEHQGFRCERGPNGFLDSKPSTVKLCEDIGLGDKLLHADDKAAKRFVMKDGELVQLPTSPGAFLTTPLLSIGGRLRVIGEMFISKKRSDKDETVAEFARRRLGAQAYEVLIDPFVSGIFAGDPEKLSVAAALPRLTELESEYGSLIKASRRLKKRKDKDDHGGAAGPGGRLTSFEGGLSVLIHALAAELGDAVVLNAPLESARRVDNTWSVTAGGEVRDGIDHLVLAIPAYATASVLAPLDLAFKTALSEVPYAPVTVLALGFRREDVGHDLDGFGYLVPGREESPLLGCLWTSSVFPGCRAPDGQVLVRVMVGGARNPQMALLPDDELVAMVLREIGPKLDLKAAPSMVRLARHRSAIPQYEVGHRDRLVAVDAALEAWPGLHLSGNAYRGVGINDCTREADALAAAILG